MRGNDTHKLIEPPPDSFFEPVTVDNNFEEEFTLPEDCDGKDVCDGEHGVTNEFHTCGQWDAFIYHMDGMEDYDALDYAFPIKYYRLRQSYKFFQRIGLNIPAHKFTDKWVAVKAIPQGIDKYSQSTLLAKTNRNEYIDMEELTEILIKYAFVGGSDIASSNIVVDGAGTPYLIDFSSLQEMYKRYETQRKRIQRVLSACGKPEESIELFEARLFSVLATFPRERKNYSYDSPSGKTVTLPTEEQLIPKMYRNPTDNTQAEWVPFSAVQHGLLKNIPKWWREFNPLTVDIWNTTYNEYKEIRNNNKYETPQMRE